ncbi:MAG: threonine synthase [Helicobacter sp.]|nr:threonine synthase [Helicobacter sp.]
MHFISTRSNDKENKNVNLKQAIMAPNAPNGGLWSFDDFPKIDLLNLDISDYKAFCMGFLNQMLKNEDEQIRQIFINSLDAYSEFDYKTPKLQQISEHFYSLLLYHGKTRSFKDMALAPLGNIISSLAQLDNKKLLILVATSGDTGPAALSSFANKNNIHVICLYPKNGTSLIQKLQMTSQNAKNLSVFGINGNFDDAQKAVKNLLKDQDFLQNLQTKGYALSVANSINIGRIIFQIIYYVWSYCKIKAARSDLNANMKVIIPSGNLGNALGAFYARNIVPISKIVVANNANNVVYEFLKTGIYDLRSRKLEKTLSPAMDILIASNLERILFALFGAEITTKCMLDLQNEGIFTLNKANLEILQNIFEPAYCDDTNTLKVIKKYYEKGFLLDPHSASAFYAHDILKDHNLCLAIETAEFSKFPKTVVKAIFDNDMDDKTALLELSKKHEISPKILDLLHSKDNDNHLNLNDIKLEILKAI